MARFAVASAQVSTGSNTFQKDLEARIAGLDTSTFGHIDAQLSNEDRRSLLALHDWLGRSGTFRCLEIGSHLGGSLQVFVADERCRSIISIDPRPQKQPDDRSGASEFEYTDNSTQRMLGLLADVPGADVSKLETVQASTEDVAPGQFARPDYCFIDGEHTRSAALRDARFCRAVNQAAGLIVFHDAPIVAPAIVQFLRETDRVNRAYLLSNSVFVVELGSGPSALAHPGVRGQLRHARLWLIANSLRLHTLVAAVWLYKTRGHRRPR